MNDNYETQVDDPAAAGGKPAHEPAPELTFQEGHDLTYEHDLEHKKGKRKKIRKKKKKGRFRLFFLSILVLIAGFMLGRISAVRPFMSHGDFDNKSISNKVRSLANYIDTFYLDEYDDEKLEDGIYHGMVSGLGDPYSEYYSSEEYSDMMEGDSGEYRGIGIIVYKDSASGYVTIESVMKDQPAYNAGVENGDILISVDGKETRDITLTETVGMIKRGESDTVKLVLLRDNKTIEKVVNKTNIVLETVEHEMKKDKIGYISISQFIENTDEQFAAAVDDLNKKGMKGLIIDLRDNGGGLVDSCVNMISRIVPEGKLVVYMEDKNGQREDYNSNNPQTLDLPIVVLVNGNTASASEIMTGCLKDYGLATVVGSKTYGKGIVQNVMPLGDGSALKLTVAAYYTPNGVNIHKKGIEPDVDIEYTTKEWAKIRKDPSKDKQMKEAISILKEKMN